MVKFKSIKVTKISETIVDQIEEYILSGALKSGERLPPERELADQLGVSRPSIREAIAILESKGLVKTKRGGGTVVTNIVSEELTGGSLASMLSERPETTYDVLELRQALEETAAYYAALRATKTDKEIIQRRLDNLIKCYNSDIINPEIESKSDVEFHLSIADASHNIAIIQVMRGLLNALEITVSQNLDRIRSSSEDHKIIQSQHQSICDAILNGDAISAKQHAHDHLAFVEQKLYEFTEENKREQLAQRRLSNFALPHDMKNQQPTT